MQKSKKRTDKDGVPRFHNIIFSLVLSLVLCIPITIPAKE